jgi:hypothetical protein
MRLPVALYGTVRIHIGFNTDPDSQGFDDQELKNNLAKNCNLFPYPWALHKGRPVYRRSLQLSKENITSKHGISYLFYVCRSFCPA